MWKQRLIHLLVDAALLTIFALPRLYEEFEEEVDRFVSDAQKTYEQQKKLVLSKLPGAVVKFIKSEWYTGGRRKTSRVDSVAGYCAESRRGGWIAGHGECSAKYPMGVKWTRWGAPHLFSFFSQFVSIPSQSSAATVDACLVHQLRSTTILIFKILVLKYSFPTGSKRTLPVFHSDEWLLLKWNVEAGFVCNIRPTTVHVCSHPNAAIKPSRNCAAVHGAFQILMNLSNPLEEKRVKKNIEKGASGRYGDDPGVKKINNFRISELGCPCLCHLWRALIFEKGFLWSTLEIENTWL